MIKIAITGNIASGKSLAEQYIISKGYPVYDTDCMAHDVLDKMTEFYGYDVFTNGKTDRKKLGNLVFSDSDLKKKLENIIHPQVKKMILEVFKKHKQESCVFISVPLLYEAGFDTLFDKIIFVSLNESIQKERLIKRSNLSELEAELRIKSQMPQNLKLDKADYVINNDSTPENLYKQIDSVLSDLQLE